MPELSPELRAAGVIGTWRTDVSSALSILDAGAAELLAGDVGLAGQGVPLQVALGRAHPDDRDWLFERIYRARRTGGPISAEFRIVTATGETRWILNRGSLAPDEAGQMLGCGAYIDTTNSHRGPFLPAGAAAPDDNDPLDTAALRCIQAREAIIPTKDRRLLQLSDALLFAVGQALARRMQA